MPEVPPVSRPLTLGQAVADALGEGGALSRLLPDFEPRQSQTQMAGAVADVLEQGGVLLAEAGTGTGKTLAYLIPAILSGQRVLVSTGTKNLQEQIFFKDVPTVRAALQVAFSATCMKGRANYLCLYRLDQHRLQPSLTGLGQGSTATLGGGALDPMANFLQSVGEWASGTETGDRAELEDLAEDSPLWNEVAATAETCLGTECPRYDECFVTRMRQRAAVADLVIVNHHLLCADLAVRQSAYGEVIPSCQTVILDEAHQLEEVATQYFGLTASTYRGDELARDVEQLADTVLAQDPAARAELRQAAWQLRDSSRAFFTELAVAHRPDGAPRHDERVRATDTSLAAVREPAAQLTGTLEVIESMLERHASHASPEDDGSSPVEPCHALARRAAALRSDLRVLVRAADPQYVYYVEFRGRGVFLRASPIDVAGIIRELLLDRVRAAILTSATLTVDGTFHYVRERLGIAQALEVQLPSEFDFTRQAILYLPRHMPDPRSPAFQTAAGREIVAILKRTEGRAFVLFTSYAMLRTVQGLAEVALDYPILVQGEAPRGQLLREFRATPHAVLLATSSFWQGVDVIGEALSCVIIDKLPFASPSDPVTAARIEAIAAQGGEPFGEYQLPLAILALRQGLGRLIRHRRDRGVLAVLDPRLRTKAYGRRFLASLPPAPVVHDLAHIERFLSG